VQHGFPPHSNEDLKEQSRNLRFETNSGLAANENYAAAMHGRASELGNRYQARLHHQSTFDKHVENSNGNDYFPARGQTPI